LEISFEHCDLTLFVFEFSQYDCRLQGYPGVRSAIGDRRRLLGSVNHLEELSRPVDEDCFSVNMTGRLTESLLCPSTASAIFVQFTTS
jgi:hypothetical protein